MNAYIDSSVILRFILNQKNSFQYWDKITKAGTSELTWVECCRTLDRLRLEKKITDSTVALANNDLKVLFTQLIVFGLSRDILLAAATPNITILGTLDSIHLHTALLWKSESKAEVTMVSHDKQLIEASMARHLQISS